jgi:AcrR family transcriptional regulator
MQEPSRRVPRQARSKERVERILDAAAHVFAEAGYEAATTEAIAARAETSIGSVYQFFPNKDALFGAISARYFERVGALFEGLMGRAREVAWEELLDEAIDGFAAFDRTDLDFRAVWRNWHRSGEFMETGQAMNRAFAKRTEMVLAAHARKKIAPKKLALVATVAVETISAMLFLSAREPKMGKAVVAETKVLLRRYLAAYAK